MLFFVAGREHGNLCVMSFNTINTISFISTYSRDNSFNKAKGSVYTYAFGWNVCLYFNFDFNFDCNFQIY